VTDQSTMNVILKDGNTFRQIVSCMKDLITDSGEIVFNSKGLSIQSVDTLKVVLIDMILEEEAFLKYKLDVEEVKLALNFENFNNVLKLSKSTRIGMSYKPGTEKLALQLNEHDNKKIQFDMTLSSVDKTELEITDIEYSVKVYIDATEFQKSIKDLSSFGKKCSISVEGGDITLSVTGDAGNGQICISDAEIEYSFASEETSKFEALFNLKYLNLFAKAGLSNEIILKFGKGVPFCFEYVLEYGHVKFFMSEMPVE